MRMFRLSFLEIKSVKSKEDSKWAILSYLPFAFWGALILLFMGNPFQKRHAKFSLLLCACLMVWALIGRIFSDAWMNVPITDPSSNWWVFGGAVFMIGVLVLALYYFYAAYLSLTSRYVAVTSLID